jgi:hypothetical protein
MTSDSDRIKKDAKSQAGSSDSPEDALKQILNQPDIRSSNLNLESVDTILLLPVAHAHAGKPLTLEPVAVELVQAMLKSHFNAKTLPPPTMQSAARTIAATLMEDPGSRERLERLWSKLCGTKK